MDPVSVLSHVVVRAQRDLALDAKSQLEVRLSLSLVAERPSASLTS